MLHGARCMVHVASGEHGELLGKQMSSFRKKRGSLLVDTGHFKELKFQAEDSIAEVSRNTCLHAYVHAYVLACLRGRACLHPRPCLCMHACM